MPLRQGESGRGLWQSQSYVIESINGNFIRRMTFDVFGKDRIDRFGIAVGQELTVYFDIDAKEYQGKWFNAIRAYDVREAKSEPAQEEQANNEDPFDAQGSDIMAALKS